MTDKKEDTKKSTKATKKKSTPKKVKLTYRPLFSASRSFTASLTKKTVKIDHGLETIITEPLIKGLPTLLTVHAGEVIEVTKTQFEALEKAGFIESKEQVAKRKELERRIPKQHPERLTYDMMANNIDNSLTPLQSSNLYSDKLIVVD
jgi:hypothetical protein